ncbi:MAG: hypothetical protein VYE65_04270 [SAR324 cluster bacterium]|nr:hypothetical protein [SAR324 cluster bacterium]MED5515975.1 hypothetical protein [SAR324 cluster bacterium]MED6339839.1 hypothetical protein [SAR324 cluster bacterium]
MDKTRIIPISGEHFDEFILLTNPEHKSSRKKQAWQALRQQIQVYTPDSLKVDLNRICVDTIRMELLIFPVVEHWKRPLTNAEWSHIEKEAKQLEHQMDKLRKLSSLVRKKDPLSFADLAPLFNKLFEYNLELRNNWKTFKNAWSDYKKGWQQFQTKKKQLLRSKKHTTKSEAESFAKVNSADKEIEPPESPPMFSRDRWHALRISSKALEIEVLHQCQRFRDGIMQEEEDLNNETHPVVKFLVEELRKIYLKTHGFELIERVKLVQHRNDQLIQELQPYFTEPIISEEMKAETKTTSPLRNISAKKINKDKSSGSNSLRRFVLILLLIMLGVFIIFLLKMQDPSPGKNLIKHLKFFPKNKTLTADSKTDNKPSEFNMEDMMQEFGSNISVQESNERLKKMITASPQILDKIANSILQEIGENAVFVFSEAQTIYLFWKGKLEKFASPEDLKKKLKQLKQKYMGVESLWKQMGDKTPENVKVVPDVLDGESTYALEMLDENGDPLKAYMSEEGVLLRLSNGQLLDKPLTPYEAAQKISEL